VAVDHQLGEAQYLSAQMESVAEARLLSFLGRECLDRLQVEVVVEMQVVQVLAVDEQVEHVVTLSTNRNVARVTWEHVLGQKA